MEKLQKALRKARQERGDAAGRAPLQQSAHNPQAAAQSVHFSPAWDKLASFEPDPDHLKNKHITTLHSNPDSNLFDILRTKLFLMMREKGWTRLAITSPDKGCGKTTVACNLAVGFSRQREIKSLLFDFDLRNPSVASMMGHMPEHDVSEMLLGDVPPEKQMVRFRDNTAMSLAKRAMHDPLQVLMPSETGQILDDIEATFDPAIMLFDLPPILVSDDVHAVLKYVDCAVIVVRAEQTRAAQFDQCEREVGEHTNVLGTVLNNCRHLTPGEDYYGEYK